MKTVLSQRKSITPIIVIAVVLIGFLCTVYYFMNKNVYTVTENNTFGAKSMVVCDPDTCTPTKLMLKDFKNSTKVYYLPFNSKVTNKDGSESSEIYMSPGSKVKIVDANKDIINSIVVLKSTD